ncbi:hypothetical protein SAMN05216376_106213 [Mameliella alba]|nr:hypothetical protein [Mameliella alba]PTR39693.1 hypothetical protein LX94_02065 [Mameliella alba]SDD15406.1 hypothetical protein SAMN05216376_106213 [Mameliella alba]
MTIILNGPEFCKNSGPFSVKGGKRPVRQDPGSCGAMALRA